MGECVVQGGVLQAYSTDLDYLQDCFSLVSLAIKLSHAEAKHDDAAGAGGGAGLHDSDDEGGLAGRSRRRRMFMGEKAVSREQERQDLDRALRKLRAREALLRKRVDRRLALTRAAGRWVPRLERLCEALALCPFERSVVVALIARRISPASLAALPDDGMGLGGGEGLSGGATAGALLQGLAGTLEGRIAARRHFYKNATLVREGIVALQGADFSSDLGCLTVELDRRMLDYVVGLDTEFSEIVDGSHLYTPKAPPQPPPPTRMHRCCHQRPSTGAAAFRHGQPPSHD